MANRQFARMLAVKLSEKELLARGAELAETDREILKLKEEKRATSAEYRVRLKPLEQLSDSLSKTIHVTKTEDRSVRCEERANFKQGKVEVVRLDTKEVIETRALTAAERQTKLVDDDTAEEDAATAAGTAAYDAAQSKRKRGRPKKTAEPAPVLAFPKGGTGKKRGRPKKPTANGVAVPTRTDAAEDDDLGPLADPRLEGPMHERTGGDAA